MGRLAADAGKRDWDELTTEYGAQLMEGLAVMGTRGKHVNVLQHLMGYLKNHLSSEDTPQARRPGTLAGEAQQAGPPGPYRELPAGAGAADRAADAAQAPLESLPGARVGAPTGLPTSVSERADAAESRVGPSSVDGQVS